MRLLTAACAVSLVVAAPAFAAGGPWRDLAADAVARTGQRVIVPKHARLFELDSHALDIVIARLPAQAAARGLRPSLTLPLPDGRNVAFELYETAVMAPELAAKFPQIRTFAGAATDGSGLTGRFDVGPRGFHGMILSPRGTIYIDPYSRGDTLTHQSYFKRDLPARSRAGDEVLRSATASQARPAAGADGVNLGGSLRTYRLALATTGEYARFQSATGDKTVILAELVNVVNRVNTVYERDVGVSMQLVPNEDLVIFTNASTDPYTNDNGGAMLDQNISALNARLGAASYDIGHVVSTGGGGVAYLGVICGSDKGGGVTGLDTPVGDGFYIDYVAHEMGHQFGGNHTFNSVSGACGGGNRNGPTAYEPGSGISVMAYAGICNADDLALHSEDYFHGASVDEIVAYTRTSTGSTCGVATSNANHAPVTTVPASGFTIPARTPFELTGSASDADADALTFQWEQRDLGTGGAAESPAGNAPIFRDFLPSASPTRTFPALADLLAGTHHIGELLPTTNRTLHFRLTARDNHVAPSSGGVNSADLSFAVSAASGPFKVTVPNDTTARNGGSTLTVTWDVAGTSAAPVSCSTVDIKMSTNGGQTFTRNLVLGTPNDGSQQVTLPNVSSTGARVKVKCANNIFFDVGDTNFKLTKTTVSDTTPAAFHFTDATGVALNHMQTSNQITISGINAPAPLTLTSTGKLGSYSVNGGAYARAATTVVNGDTITLRLRASTDPGVTRQAVLNIGGVTDTWTVSSAP